MSYRMVRILMKLKKRSDWKYTHNSEGDRKELITRMIQFLSLILFTYNLWTWKHGANNLRTANESAGF